MLSLIKTLIPVYHSIAFCLFCYTDTEAIGQVPGSGTWDKGERPRYAEKASGWAEWTSLDSHT